MPITSLSKHRRRVYSRHGVQEFSGHSFLIAEWIWMGQIEEYMTFAVDVGAGSAVVWNTFTLDTENTE